MAQRTRGWCFTRNKRDDERALPAPWSALPEGAQWLVFQEERAERSHYQGAVWFKSQVTLATAVRRLGGGGIHLEKAVGTPLQNKTYCTKTLSRVNGPWEHGSMPQQGQRSDLSSALDVCKKRGYQEAFLEHPTTVAKYTKGFQAYEFVIRKKQRID